MSSFDPSYDLRDALVPLIQSYGRNPFPAPWDKWVPLLKLEVFDSTLVLGGPFATPNGSAFHILEVHRSGQEVFCLKWDEDGTGEVLTSVRGEWETDFSNPTNEV